MGRTYILAVLTAASVALAGCQSGSKTPSGDTTQSAEKRTSTSAMTEKNMAWAKALEEAELSPEHVKRMEAIGVKMGERIVALCQGSRSVAPLRECFHRQMLVAFDADGVVADHCPQDDDLMTDFQCVALAAFSYDLAKRAGGAAMVEFDWSDLEHSGTAAIEQIVLEQLRGCLSNGSASDPMDCVENGVAKALGLNAPELEQCEGIEDDEAVGRCYGEVYGYKLMLTALGRLEELDA